MADTANVEPASTHAESGHADPKAWNPPTASNAVAAPVSTIVLTAKARDPMPSTLGLGSDSQALQAVVPPNSSAQYRAPFTGDCWTPSPTTVNTGRTMFS